MKYVDDARQDRQGSGDVVGMRVEENLYVEDII